MRTNLIACAIVLVACSKAEKMPDSTAVAAPAAAAPVAPPAFSLSDAAGAWTYVAKSATGDTVLVTSQLHATASTTGWTLTLPDRTAIPMTVTVSGDSIMTSAGPYKSVLRKGVMVTTSGVLRMVGGKMVGTSTAHYSVKTADSVRALMIEATRKP
jgi:hypothetical protein